jgi:hypothetical protein
MKEIETVNATISRLWWEREHCLSHWIMLEGDGWGCGFGGYFLKGEACFDWIEQVMETLDLYEFDDSKLIGMVIRAKTEGIGGGVIAIGHPIKNKWFEPREFFKKYNKGAK